MNSLRVLFSNAQEFQINLTKVKKNWKTVLEKTEYSN